MGKGRVLIAAPVHEVLTKGLQEAGFELVSYPGISQEKAAVMLADCVGVITSTRLHLDKRLIDAAPLLRWIGRMGSGMEVMDVPYARSKGIACYSSPEGNRNAVAEHALGMLLALNKRILLSNEELKQGIWERDGNRGTELEGKTIGIIGFGHTGQAFAKKLLGFDMHILVYDKYKQADMPGYVTYCESLEPIYKEADIVSFHVPLQQDTVHYFDDKFIAAMHKGFILLNTSRGVVADIKAIKNGMESGKIEGACLDVWEEEPLEQMSTEVRALFEELLRHPKVVITPHIAGYSKESIYKMSKVLLERIVSV